MFRRRSNETSVDELAAAHGSRAVTVDVREPDEYAGGHVPGARNIPLGRLDHEVPELAREAQQGTVYVICASGNRSRSGAGLLSRAGIDARSVAGGTAAWSRAGHRVVTGSRPS